MTAPPLNEIEVATGSAGIAQAGTSDVSESSEESLKREVESKKAEIESQSKRIRLLEREKIDPLSLTAVEIKKKIQTDKK